MWILIPDLLFPMYQEGSAKSEATRLGRALWDLNPGLHSGTLEPRQRDKGQRAGPLAARGSPGTVAPLSVGQICCADPAATPALDSCFGQQMLGQHNITHTSAISSPTCAQAPLYLLSPRPWTAGGSWRCTRQFACDWGYWHTLQEHVGGEADAS